MLLSAQPWFLFALACAPGLAIALYLFIRDKYEKEPIQQLLVAFLLGMLSCLPAFILQRLGAAMGFGLGGNILQIAIFAFIIVAGSEELSKFMFARIFAYPSKAFNEPFDGIVYATMLSLGFATLENVLYLMGPADFNQGLQIGILRMFTAVPAQASFGIMMGYYMGMAKFSAKNKTALMLQGLLIAIVLHGAYDFFLMQRSFAALSFLAFFVLIIGIRMSNRAIIAHQEISPFKPNNNATRYNRKDPEYKRMDRSKYQK